LSFNGLQKEVTMRPKRWNWKLGLWLLACALLAVYFFVSGPLELGILFAIAFIILSSAWLLKREPKDKPK
jgi:predicted outer membrane lipoprotein